MTRPRLARPTCSAPIGRGTEQVWASTRAGIARIGNSHVMDQHFDPIQMGLVPEDALGAAAAGDRCARRCRSRARRMLRLAAPVTRRRLPRKPGDGRAPLFIGLPQLIPREAPWLAHFPSTCRQASGVPIDLATQPHRAARPRGGADGASRPGSNALDQADRSTGHRRRRRFVSRSPAARRARRARGAFSDRGSWTDSSPAKARRSSFCPPRAPAARAAGPIVVHAARVR